MTAVSGSKVSISGIGTIDTAENGTSVYDGVAKDDVVAVTKLYQDKTADATFVIEKAEAVSGTVTAYNAKTITLEGTVYDVYNEANYKSGLTDDAVPNLSSDDLDKEFTLYLVNGYVRAVQKGSEDMNQYAIVVDKDDNGVLDSTFKEPKAELLFADGSKKTVILHKDSKIYSDNSVTTPTNTFNTLSKNVSDLQKNQIVKYAEMSNGQYKIEECGTYTKATGSETLYNKDTKAFLNGGSLTVTDGACVLFYNNGSEADQTITFANALKLEGEAYVEDGKTTKAIDEDAKIVYIDADNQTKGDDGMGITSFDGTTGYANALIVYEGGVATNKIVAIIVNTNSDTDVLGKTDVMGTKTVTAPGSVTMTNANGLTASAVADKTTAVKGEVITYTVTFSGTTTAATKVTFTAGSNSTVDTAKCVVTGNWVAQSATQANIATTKDGTGTVTFKVIANGSGSVGTPTIAVANQ